MKTNYAFSLALLCVVSLSSFTFNRWTLIGQKEANFGMDRDVLVVRGFDVYKAIKLKVVDAGLNMKDLDIHFENGEVMHIPIQKDFYQGEESRVIDLKGNKRRLEKITFLYDTKGLFKGKANVLVFGKR